jgi:hypothetical protein
MDHVFAQPWTNLSNTCSRCGKKVALIASLVPPYNNNYSGCTGSTDAHTYPKLLHRGTMDVWMIAPNNTFYVYSGATLPFPMEGTDTNNQPVTYYGDGHDYERWLGVLRGKAAFNEVPFRDPVINIGDCHCSIANLLSTGHDAGCPEKK